MSDPKQDKPAEAVVASQEEAMAPGDQVPPGTPGAGDNVCPRCGGSGRLNQQECTTCSGTGIVVEVVGGGG
jgi:hypothetical protein